MRVSKFALLKSVIFCVVLVCVSSLMTFLLYPLSSLNQHFIGYHSVKENIDFLVLGNSLEGDGVNASVISDELHVNAYTFSAQGAYPESLYYTLIDVSNQHNIKTVLIGWDIIQNFQFPPYIYPHSEELWREFAADLRGNPLLTKIVFQKVMAQRYTSSFFKWSSFPENILEIPAVLKSKGVIKTVHEDFPPKPINVSELETDASFNYHKVIDGSYTNVIQENDIKYIKLIRDFCKQKNIILYFISNPIPNCVISKLPQFAECIQVTKTLMDDLDIAYINASDQRWFPYSTVDTNFKDCFGHIISPYREVYSKQICDYIQMKNVGLPFLKVGDDRT